MDLKTARAANGMTQAALAKKTGIDQSLISRLESGEREPNIAQAAILSTVLERTVDPSQESLDRTARRRGSTVRRAYWCQKCSPPRRVFLTPDEPDVVPYCDDHGKMERQENKPRKGRRVPA